MKLILPTKNDPIPNPIPNQFVNEDVMSNDESGYYSGNDEGPFSEVMKESSPIQIPTENKPSSIFSSL